MKTLSTPDPKLGLFETLLVLDREAVALDAHLERLAASLSALYDTALPPALSEEIAAHASGLELGRMRIVIDTGGEATFATEAVDPLDFFPDQERAAELRSARCPGGLGRHKWADRRPLGESRSGPVSLLLDAGDEVLEAGRGNVFAVVGGALFTPKADGRILPGTARAAAIELAGSAGVVVREESFSRDDLLGAEEAFLTGSVRGVEPIRSLDGEPAPPLGAIGEQVAADLARRWRTGRPVAARS